MIDEKSKGHRFSAKYPVCPINVLLIMYIVILTAFRPQWTILKNPSVRDHSKGVNTSPLLILEFTLASLKGVAAGTVFHEVLKSLYVHKPDKVRYPNVCIEYHIHFCPTVVLHAHPIRQ